MSDEPPKQRRPHVADPVHFADGDGCRHSGEQVIDLTTDQRVFVRKAEHGVGQPRRGLEEIAIQSVGTLARSRCAHESRRELHRSSVNAFGPTHWIGRGWRGRASSTRSSTRATPRGVAGGSARRARSDVDEFGSIALRPLASPLGTSVARSRLPGDRRMRCALAIVTVGTSKGVSWGRRRRTGRESAGGGAVRVERAVRGHHPWRTLQCAAADGDRLAAGYALGEHENTGEITLQMIRGRARVVAASGDAQLVAGDYVVIPQEWDSFEALEDTVVSAHRHSAGQPGLTWRPRGPTLRTWADPPGGVRRDIGQPPAFWVAMGCIAWRLERPTSRRCEGSWVGRCRGARCCRGGSVGCGFGGGRRGSWRLRREGRGGFPGWW